jgi:uncharacterized iron-regulated protein
MLQQAGEPGPHGATWVSPLARNHPLVGRIYDVELDRTVTWTELEEAVAAADIVFLGEQHDNADHHRVQARLLEDIVAAGRRPAVAFEQLDLEDQPEVDHALEARQNGHEPTVAARASAVAQAVDWEHSSWPPFDQYRGIFEVALRADLPLRAANLSRAAMRGLLSRETATARDARPLCGAAGGEGWRGVPLSDEARAAMAADIEESHCGYADEHMVATMTEAQRRRDDAMASAVVAALRVSERRLGEAAASASRAGAVDGVPALRPGVVLVCGYGHARRDYAAPVYLLHHAPAHRVVSVAVLEVIAGRTTPAEYAAAFHAGRLPFDYVIFTPRADNEDPCKRFRGGLEKMKAR